jgi:hypothetical protein
MDDLLDQLLSKMSINDSMGREIKPATADLDYESFNDLLVNSPYTVQANPNFVPIIVNGIQFESISIPRDKKKIGWKELFALCKRVFFTKSIKGRTLYDRLRKKYYTNGEKTLLKINGTYYIYENGNLTIAQMPPGFTDYVSPLNELYNYYDRVSNPNDLKQLLYASVGELLLGTDKTPEELTKLIDTLPVFKQPVTGKRERSPDVEMVVDAKRYRNSFGKLTLSQINRMLKYLNQFN